jgi:hypothetical protein
MQLCHGEKKYAQQYPPYGKVHFLQVRNVIAKCKNAATAAVWMQICGILHTYQGNPF